MKLTKLLVSVTFLSLNCAIHKNYQHSINFINQLYNQAKKDLSSGKKLTQSQAHLMSQVLVGSKKLRKVLVKDRVIEKYGKYNNWIIPNKRTIKSIFEKERQFRDSGKNYYVFYTAVPYMHLMQDLNRRLYEYNYGKEGALKDSSFQFLRYFHNDPFFDQYENIQKFLESEIRQNKIVDDNLLKIKIILLSFNLSVFGNIGLTGESTFYYFNNPQKWVSLSPMFIEDSLNSYGFLDVENNAKKFLDIIKQDLGYDTEPQSKVDPRAGSDFFQIFVPQELVDKIAYKSWRQGFPFDTNLLQKLFPQKLSDISTLDDSKLITSADIKDAIQKIQDGAITGIQEFLENFIKKPQFSLKNYIDKDYITRKDPLMNFVQARGLITNEDILNPKSGIKIYRYTSIPASNLSKYKRDFNSEFQKLTSKQPKAEGQFDARLISTLIRTNNLLETQNTVKKFTQTQTLLNIHEVAETIKKFAKAAYKNKQLVFKILEREKQYENYYVFYTAVPYMRLFQDVINFLYKNLKNESESLKQNEFIFLRYDLDSKIYTLYNKVNEFLIHMLKKYCIVDDRHGTKMKTLLLSTNVSLFGNADLIGESTWGFFNNPQSWVALNKIFLENILESFGFSKDLSQDLMNNYEMLKDSSNQIPPDLIQIFIPKNMANEIAYICWTRGIPFDLDYIRETCKFLNYVPAHVKQIFGKDKFQDISSTQKGSVKELVSEVKDKCRKTFPTDIVDNLISKIKKKVFSPSNLLGAENISPSYPYYQARILFTKDKMLNPESGIKIFRYSQLTPAQEQAYNQELDGHLNKILDEYKKGKAPSDKGTKGVQEIISECLSSKSSSDNDNKGKIEKIISECLKSKG